MKPIFKAGAWLLLALASMPAGSLAQGAASLAWPEFRGPTSDGHVSGSSDSLPLYWSETSKVVWKTEIPFRGWSTPVIGSGRIWVTTATPEGHDFYAICVNEGTGKLMFNQHLFHVENPEPLGNGASMNCYATPSSVLDEDRVFVHFGSFGTACLDAKTGEVLWKRNDLPCRHYRGPSSSLVSYKNLIILTMDGADLQYHAALDKKTGKTVWKTNRSVAWNDENVPGQMARDGDQRKAHSTPLMATVNEKPMLISAGAKAAYGYEPATGAEIWRVCYPDFSTAPRPLYENRLAFIVTGLTKTELLAIHADRKGDVTETAVAWKLRTHVGKYSSPIMMDGLIYTAAEESFVTCLEANTGNVVWTERIEGQYAASPMCSTRAIYFCSQDGTTTVLKPGRDFKVMAKNSLDNGFMASPAADGNALFLRTKKHLYKVEAKGKS